MRKKEEKKLGKNVKRHIAFPVLMAIITVFVMGVCFFPYLPLKDGTFIKSVLKGLHGVAKNYLGFYFPDDLNIPVLAPFALYSLINLVYAIFGVNVVFWILDACIFEGLYLFCAWYYIDDRAGQLALFGRVPYELVGFALAGLGILFLAAIVLSKLIKKIRNRKKKVKEKRSTEAENSNVSAKDSDEPAITHKEAVSALRSTELPEFRNYPNCFDGLPEIPVGGNIYESAFAEGEMRRNAEKRREEENEKKFARLESIFSLKNIRDRVIAERVDDDGFSEYHGDMDIDIQGVSDIQLPQPVQPVQQVQPSQPQVVYVQTPSPQPNVIYVNVNGQNASVSPQASSEQNPQNPQNLQNLQNPQSLPTQQTQQNPQVFQQPSSVQPVPSGQPVQPSVPLHHPRQPQSIPVSEGKSIIDEGTKSDDFSDFSRELEEDDSRDLESGVGGLVKSRDGYVFNSSRFRWEFPPESLLKHYQSNLTADTDIGSDADGKIIVDTFSQFRIETNLIGIQRGPTFTLYELTLARGIKLASVLTLADNLAMDLAVQSVRIVAPLPGIKSAIGVEVPNRKRETIGFDVMMPALKAKKLRIPMVLGRTITGDSIVIDLAGAPHLLVAGTTGSGKSVCINSLICSVLFTKTPRDVRMILVDPKMVELSVYNDIPHLLTPVITEPKKAIRAMAFIVGEMERRMAMFSKLKVRKIEDYNDKISNENLLRERMPYIMVIIDEFADLMMVAGKELENYIKRITAVARFTGIHIVLATQRPSNDVITGIIKSNMPTQIAFAVSNQINSRIIIDTNGAEKLLGRGDMLYVSAANPTPQRIQGAFIDPEIESIVNFVKSQGKPDYIDDCFLEEEDDEDSAETSVSDSDGGGDLFDRAWRILAAKGEASASYLQRKMSIGYNRAATLIEQLEEAGYIGPARGSKPREILRFPEDEK